MILNVVALCPNCPLNQITGRVGRRDQKPHRERGRGIPTRGRHRRRCGVDRSIIPTPQARSISSSGWIFAREDDEKEGSDLMNPFRIPSPPSPRIDHGHCRWAMESGPTSTRVASSTSSTYIPYSYRSPTDIYILHPSSILPYSSPTNIYIASFIIHSSNLIYPIVPYTLSAVDINDM